MWKKMKEMKIIEWMENIENINNIENGEKMKISRNILWSIYNLKGRKGYEEKWQ